MALQVWLPLNGDLHNQGLLNWQPSLDNGTTASYMNGKIGQALNTGAITMPAEITAQILNNNNYSYTCWFCALGTSGSTTERAMIFGNDGMSALGGRQFSLFQYSTANDLHWSWQNYTGGIYSSAYGGVLSGVFPTNQWVHLAITYDNPNVKIYINGQIKYTGSWVSNADSFEYNTKLIWNSQYHKINDVRIYDHALSDKEVEEIAKGLVLHYKLDNNGLGGENLVTGSNTNNTSTNKWVGHSAVGGNTSSIVIDETGTPCVQVTRDDVAQSSWDYLSYDNFLRNKIKTNTTYSVSFDAKPSVDGNIGFTGFVNGNATNYMTNSTTIIQGSLKANQWNHCQYLCTTISSFNDITIGSQVVYFSRSTSLRGTNVTVLFKNIKVEEGNVFTSWSPAKTDPNYPQNNDTIIYDCSGYDNNGIITGTLETITSNVRYNCATQFDNKEYITHKLPENMYYATYSFWVKASSYTSYGAIYMPYQSPSAGTSPWFAINTESCKVWAYFGNNSPNYTKGSGTMSLNEWHHCVYVWNNGIAQWYVDGEKNGNSVTYTTRTYIQNTANATIGNSYTGTSWNGTPFSGQISDFRVYATALTAEQIKELYHTSATIDNNGNIYARELVEE